jgi:hypothetical protein
MARVGPEDPRLVAHLDPGGSARSVKPVFCNANRRIAQKIPIVRRYFAMRHKSYCYAT